MGLYASLRRNMRMVWGQGVGIRALADDETRCPQMPSRWLLWKISISMLTGDVWKLDLRREIPRAEEETSSFTSAKRHTIRDRYFKGAISRLQAH